MATIAHPINEPSDPPPPYSVNAKPPKTRSGIEPSRRRSMEDEWRSLPAGWVRQYDDKSHHQFFVNTTVDPARSMWHHPYDDTEYLNSLPADERNRIQSMHPQPSQADLEVESSDEEGGHGHGHEGKAMGAGAHGGKEASGAQKFGRKLKDTITHSTHEGREAEREANRKRKAAERKRREEEERRAYEQHQAFRAAMVKAMETGEPQLLGKDREGKEVYIEPPMMGGAYGGGLGGGLGGGGFGGGGPFGGRAYDNGYGYNPYQQGIYGNPNSRYVRPQMPYGRSYGMGYGGGMGLPLLGGLAGGALLGGLLF